MRKSTNGILWLAIALAAIVHWILADLPSPLSTPPRSLADKKAPPADAPIELERWDPKKQIVQSSKAKEQDPDTKDREAKYGGEFKNRVKKETQGPRSGRFREGRPLAIPRQPAGPGEDGMPSLSDLMAFGASPNALGDELAPGNQTVLNTDPVRYASFINRIADKIYDPWVSFARDAVGRMYHGGKQLEANTYITKLQVVLDSDGAIRAIQTLASSGIDELDEAPKKAFWEVEPFPNPPGQMFEKDSMVRFIYEFHFEWKTSSFNIVPWAI